MLIKKVVQSGATLALVVTLTALPSVCLAKDDTPSIVSYGFDGFWTGAQVGLAVGYLATGSEYESEEWRKLVFGAGVGALAGVGVGLTLGVVSAGQRPPQTGYLILRDVGYGVGLGAVVGTAVGALFLIDSGRPKNLLTGAAVGTLVGAGVGVAFGLIESAAVDRGSPPVVVDGAPIASVRLTLIGAGESLWPMPALEGTF
jgi:hypothetical protein